MAIQRQFTRNQHYVPQFYLRRFSSGNSKRIATYDPRTGRIGTERIKDVCVASYLYEVRIGDGDDPDSFLEANVVENALKTDEDLQHKAMCNVARAAKEGRDIRNDDISRIADFAITILLRNPETLKEAVDCFIKDVEDTEAMRSAKQLSDLFHKSGYCQNLSARDIAVGAAKRTILNSIPNISEQYGPRKELKDRLMTMGFSLLVCEKPNRFITSSKPVFSDDTTGRVTILWVPLSPRVIALFGKRGLPSVEKLSSDDVKSLNMLMCAVAKAEGSLVFSSSPTIFEMLKEKYAE